MSEQEISFSLGMLTMWAMFVIMDVVNRCKRAIKERKEFRPLSAEESLSLDNVKKEAAGISKLLDKNPIKSK